MANLTNFNFTKSSPVFDPTTVLVGTAVKVIGGTRAERTFFEGIGFVTATTPLTVTVHLLNLHTREISDLTVNVSDFMAGTTDLQLLTIEDGTGTENTGAAPSDLMPPEEVTNLEATVLGYNSVKLTYVLPPDSDFAYVRIYQDDVQIADNVTLAEYTVNGLSELTMYTFKVVAIDTVGNLNNGVEVSATTDAQTTI